MSVAVPVGTAYEMAQTGGIFVGFDEVWLLESVPATLPGAPKRITTDSEQIPRAEIERWMIETGALAGFGDGIGLRIISREASLVGELCGLLRASP